MTNKWERSVLKAHTIQEEYTKKHTVMLTAYTGNKTRNELPQAGPGFI